MDEKLEQHLLQDYKNVEDYDQEKDLKTRVLIESKKLWQVVGPAIIARVANYTMNVVTQAFAGHLGDVELASMSIANNVLVALNYGLLLGMATTLETLCGQAFGAKRYNMLGIYLQRSWIVLFLASILLLPLYIYATPILKLLGQPEDVAELAGLLSIWFIPMHLGFAFQCSLQRFLMSQLKVNVVAVVSTLTLVIHAFISWLFVSKFQLGVIGATVAFDISTWISIFGLLVYALGGWCPLAWNGFSMEAFSGLWEFLKLSAASGVMLCLEFWYYRILILMTGNLKNATIAVDALSVCMSINGWELMIPFAFLAATGVRVANELGAGNGKAAKFAAKVSLVQSSIIGIVFCVLIMMFHDKLALIFSSSPIVNTAVDKLSYLLAITILLNSVQPVLSGVAIGSGWQSLVAYVNIGCYYVIGVPLGIVTGWVFNLGVEGIWCSMIFGGTAVQTAILAILTMQRDWEKEARKAMIADDLSIIS
ncbi:hypothetical protein ACH5RR_034645 [Cinchona calisaya]|uniref:Protein DETOXIFICATION n=1 Tax=Cinchona calisaya TaxID=153742 RepID=A0ABD2YFF9_9GENT